MLTRCVHQPCSAALPSSLRSYLSGPPNHVPLQGTIPAAGWDLPSSLQYLEFHRHSLSGPLPPLNLPEGFRALAIVSNLLTSTLPADWRLPSTMTMLMLHGNKLEGLRCWRGACGAETPVVVCGCLLSPKQQLASSQQPSLPPPQAPCPRGPLRPKS